MFNGYLCLGGTEIGNNARARGYAESAACAVGWFVGDPCDGLAEALGDIEYDVAEIDAAPWYDPADESTSRFYGAYITSLGDISSSTREGSYTEGILPGGVPGRSRHAGKTFRVRAWLTAAGLDALQTGHDWLDAALQAKSCGTHAGGTCGATDVTVFTACPPPRQMVSDFTPWEQQAQNLFTNPSAERAGGPYEVRRNHAPNPRAISTGTAWSERHGGGGTATLTYKTTSSAMAGGTIPTFVEAERTADATTSSNWLRVSQFLSTVVTAPGEIWTLSAWVRSNVAGRVGVTLAFMNSTGGYAVNEASQTVETTGNIWHRVSVTVTAAAGAERVRIEGSMSNSVTGNQIKATGFVLERVGVELPYFDGGTPGPDPDFEAAWTGTENASPSTLTATSVTGASGTIGDQNYYRTQDSPFSGNYALRTYLRTTAAVAIAPQGVALTTGVTYTMIIRARAVDRDQVVTPRLRQTLGAPVTLEKGEWKEVRFTGIDAASMTPEVSESSASRVRSKSRPARAATASIGVALVEFTLYAGKPWFYGETQRLERSTTPAVVVQDTPFNLAIAPSAEVAGAAVVAATNYSTNPSVEVDAADWAAFAGSMTGTTVGART